MAAPSDAIFFAELPEGFGDGDWMDFARSRASGSLALVIKMMAKVLGAKPSRPTS